MSKRQIIVVDVETNGLDPQRHTVVEVAWRNLGTGAGGVFVPPHNTSDVLAGAEIKALQINRYIDRLATVERDSKGESVYKLAEQLAGNTLAGSNPTFDAAFLTHMFRGQYDEDMTFIPVWHHRLLDLSAYAAGVLGLPFSELPGLAKVCELLEVELVDAHTAAGDVAATAECFDALRVRAALSGGTEQ